MLNHLNDTISQYFRCSNIATNKRCLLGFEVTDLHLSGGVRLLI